MLLLASCGTGDLSLENDPSGESAPVSDTGVATGDEGDAAQSSTSTVPLVDRLPTPGIGLGVLELDGYAVPILQRTVGGWVVLSPCGNEVEVADGLERTGAHLVLDPGPEVAPIARAIERRLAASGVNTVLSRWANVSIDATTRAALVEPSGAHVFVTLRLVAGNAAAAGPAEVAAVHQIDSAESQRLGGLLHASLTAAMNELAPVWPTLNEPGVYPLLNQRGSDYFVVLRETTGTAAVVVDIPGLGAPAVTELLSTADGQAAMADAVAAAIELFLGSEASGNGYIEPAELVRDAPTGGGSAECDDPLLPPPVDE